MTRKEFDDLPATGQTSCPTCGERTRDFFNGGCGCLLILDGSGRRHINEFHHRCKKEDVLAMEKYKSCDNCGNPHIPASCNTCSRANEDRWTPIEDANESFERKAAQFRYETGMLAPGKDQPAAMNNSPTYEERMEAWKKWLIKTKKVSA